MAFAIKFIFAGSYPRKKRIKIMMIATIQNILLILKAPLWNVFYLP